MHSRSIVYRDLKPENVMIASDGYPVIIDLGFAKLVEHKTFTLCGTPEYLAPEIILSKGHDKSVDLWAFGVLVFEMIYGFSPFFSVGIDQVTLFKRIVQARYTFPRSLGNKDSTALIAKLLVKKPANRIGCSTASPERDVLSSNFLSFSSDELEAKEVLAPWIPQVREGELLIACEWNY